MHHARVYYEMLLHFIDDWNEQRSCEWNEELKVLSILGRKFLPHSTRSYAARSNRQSPTYAGFFFILTIGDHVQ